MNCDFFDKNCKKNKKRQLKNNFMIKFNTGGFKQFRLKIKNIFLILFDDNF